MLRRRDVGIYLGAPERIVVDLVVERPEALRSGLERITPGLDQSVQEEVVRDRSSAGFKREFLAVGTGSLPISVGQVASPDSGCDTEDRSAANRNAREKRKV